MPDSKPADVTGLLQAWSAGNLAARDELVGVVYQELRRRAAGRLRAERANHTLQPTALVHEVYLRLINQREIVWQNRAQFLGIASEMMRRILVDHARARDAKKRGGGGNRVLLDTTVMVEPRAVDLIAVDDALEKLAALDAEQGRVVELRFFAGLTEDETADALGISPATVHRKWLSAKAYLHRELAGQGP